MKTGAYFIDSDNGKQFEIEFDDETQNFNIVMIKDGERISMEQIPLELMVNQVLENADKGELFDANTFDWMPF